MKFFKKIKKIIFNPILFFKDSLWFSKPPLTDFSEKGNLIIVSTLGQLNQAQTLIKLNKLERNILVVLYTKQNLKVPTSIRNNLDKSFFSSVYFFELPLSPNKISNKKFIYINRGYSKLLKKINPLEIYVMSFAGHYAYLLSLAKKRNIKINLIEEGTATYAPLVSNYEYKNTFIEKFFLGKYLNEKGYFDDFDSLFVAFPEYGKEIFKAKSYERFFGHAGGSNVNGFIFNIKEKYKITNKDYIYVSQRYPVNFDIYYSSIIFILDKISQQIDGNIFIKLHPREVEDKNIMKLFLDKAKNNSKLIVINEPPFLIDPVVYLSNPAGIIGLSSTSMVYAPLLSASTKCISIGNILLEELERKGESNIKLIQEHLEIIKKFKFIQFINFHSSLKELRSYEAEEGRDKLIFWAENNYINKNYYYAVFFWQLAMKNDISILGDKAIWYYNALNKIGQTYKMKPDEMNYINNQINLTEKDFLIWSNILKNYNKKLIKLKEE